MSREPKPTEESSLLDAPITSSVVVASGDNPLQPSNNSLKTLENFRNTKKAGKYAKGFASQINSALASVGGWSDSAFFKYLANQPGAEAWVSKIPASTSDIRLILRNVLAGGSSAGIFFSDAIAKNDAEGVQHSIIAGYTASTILWFISTIGYASTHAFLRYLFPDKIADASVTYFDWGQIGNLPAVLMTPMTVFALQAGALKMAVFANMLFRFAIPALSYLFVMQMGMGVTGVDLANGIAPLPAFFLLAAYMHWHDAFKDLRQWSFKADFIEANRKELKPQLWKGVLMMSQRASEYLNVSLLAEMLTKLNESNLGKMNPFLQTSPFCTLAALGLGTIGNVDTREKRAALLIALARAENTDLSAAERRAALEKAEALDSALRLIVRKTFLSGTVVNVVLTLILIFLRNQITDLFASSDMTPDDRAESSMSSLWNALGLVPDAWRIIACNLNNTYDKIGTPNAISLALMTALGIFPLYGYAHLSEKNDIFMPFFWVRDLTMLLSAGIIVKILYNGINADTQKIKVTREKIVALPSPAAMPRESEGVSTPVLAIVPVVPSEPVQEQKPGYTRMLMNWVTGKKASASASVGSLNHDARDALEKDLTI